MDTTSPPLSPTRQSMSPINTSISPSGMDGANKHIRRRTSSFSDRSPTTPRSRHRFSNASQISEGGASTGEGGGGGAGGAGGGGGIGGGGGGAGLGNLADELGQLDDEDEDGEEYQDDSAMLEPVVQEVRDSGIDVSYSHARKFSSQSQKPPDEDPFTRELDELMTAVAHMSSASDHDDADPLIPRALARLQDLGNQSALEAGAQRLTTSTNSLTAHLTSQSRALQTLAQSLYPLFAPFAAAAAAAAAATTTTTAAAASPGAGDIDDTLPMLDALREGVPQPDAAALHKLQKLEHETADVVATLAALTDTLQMGKQLTNSAARHLRTTQAMVAELRREHERAEAARAELAADVAAGWEEKVRRRWCREQCGDIVSGFEANCESLRRSMELAGGVQAGA